MTTERAKARRLYREAVEVEARSDRDQIADEHVAYVVENKRLYDLAEAARQRKKKTK